MAKKLIYNYDFIPGAAGAGVVKFHGRHPQRTLLLVTNVSRSTIIYNFAGAGFGGTVSYNEEDDLTTLTLESDTSTHNTNDELQIFLDIREDKIDFSETFVDPVSKLRVSEPQNLIDTDFEYGLQPTKWETLELVNNIPSFFASNEAYSIGDVVSVQTISGSKVVTVTTLEPHGLSIGSPFDIQGLGQKTAEGKYLVTRVASTTTFSYNAKKKQTASGDISGSYTVVTPGQFYESSDIKTAGGIETNENSRSTLTVQTDYTHGFEPGSSVYLTNTYGNEAYNIDSGTAIAADGRPHIDYEPTVTTTFALDESLIVTREMNSTYFFEFTASNVDVGSNTIQWENSNLLAGDVLLYLSPPYDTAIGGLARQQLYYVKSSNASGITLCAITNGAYTTNSTITFSSAGTYNYGKHSLHLCYEIAQIQKNYANYYQYAYTRYRQTGNGSGWDLSTNSNGGNTTWGLGGKAPNRGLFIEPEGGYWLSQWSYTPHAYSTYVNANYTLGKTSSGITNDSEFMENFHRWAGYSQTNSPYNMGFGQLSFYSAGAVYYGQPNRTIPAGKLYYIPLVYNTEVDTVFFQNHGLTTGDTITYTTSSGQDIQYIQRNTTNNYVDGTLVTAPSGTSSQVTVVDNNRFKLNLVTGQPSNKMVHIRGQYELTGTFGNPTKDTFFVGDNNLAENQKVFVTTTSSFPATQTGIPIPTVNTITTVYDTTSTWAQGQVDLADAAGEKGVLVMNGSNPGLPFNSYNIATSAGNQYFYLSQFYNSYTYAYGDNFNPYFGGWIHAWGNSPRTTSYPNPYDMLSNYGQHSGKGNYLLQTTYSPNTLIDYWINIVQVPDWSYYDSRVKNLRVDYARNSWHYGNNTTYAYQTASNSYANWRTAAGGWRYAFTYDYRYPTSLYMGMLSVSISIENTNWPCSPTGAVNLFIGKSGFFGDWDSMYSGQRYIVDVLIPQKALAAPTFSWGTNSSAAETIIDDLANDIISSLSYPSFTSPTTTAYASVYNNQRISLLADVGGERYQLTGSGSDLSIATELIKGGVDGEYVITHESAEEFRTSAQYKISGRSINIGYANIVNGVFTSSSHKLKTGLKVNYNEVGGAVIAEFTSGNDYYVIAEGPDTFQLASSFENSESGLAIIPSADPTVGSIDIVIKNISARQEGEGTVTLVFGDRRVTGTDTVFTQYFKPGDEFTVKNSSGTWDTYLIAVVTDDTELYLDIVPNESRTSTQYYVDTRAYVKPDGSSQHRPFDGGVEINAGSSPNSSIVRQTRKYFRYQSGKGIQCSLAINFNPSRLIETISGVSASTIPTKTKEVLITNIGTSVYNAYGEDRSGTVIGDNKNINVIKGDTLKLIVSATGHPTYIQETQRQSGTGPNNVVTTGITNNGTDDGTIIWDTTNITAGTYYYQCSNHHTMVGQIVVEPAVAATSLVTVTTSEPHGLNRGNTVTINGSTDTEYNGTFNVVDADDFEFVYDCSSNGTPRILTTGSPTGLVNYNPGNFSNTAIRCGLYDYQNGFFFEYDGQDLYAVRRSSVQQISGRAVIETGSNIVTGVRTSFSRQLNNGDMIVIRGSSYRITAIESDTALHIQPAYKGISSSDAVVTKTIDTKVAQSDWNIDTADGTGPSGFNIDITKIQMAYLDYSWYGAGKIRFGFKDTHGHVKYMHEFIHNNRLDEAYMRSGNIPARYEIENTGGEVGFIPALFHWGTSVIMDGKFDDDKAYLFTAASNDLTFTNGDSATISTVADASLYVTYNYTQRRYYWYSKIPFATADASNFTVGVELYTSGGELNGEKVAFTDYSGGNFNVYIYVSDTRRYTPPAIYPAPANGTAVSIGAPATGSVDAVDLTQDIPLISIRLAPSVDNNLTGALGARDIINRMQLQLKQLGITVTHDCNVDLILNGSISTRSFEQVQSPSLSELVRHESGDRIFGGTKVFSLRASGGQGNVTSITEDFDLSQITDLGNSILGGDGVFPNGPDMLTIALVPKDTSLINATTPLKISSRITWTESQA